MKDHTPSSSKSDAVIDLDALADKPGSKSISIGELSELSKKDPSQLTPTQCKQVKEANEQIATAIKPMLPQIKDMMSVGQQAAKALEGLRLPAIKFPEIPDISRFVAEPPSLTREVIMPNIIPPASSTEQRKQTYLLERMVDAFEAQNAEKDADIKRIIRPNYDAKRRVLIFSNTLIEIPENSDQEVICKALFRGGKPASKPVQIGDILDKLGVPMDQLKGNKKVHYAKSALNTRIAKATQVDDLFVIEKKRLWFNQKYL